MASEKDTERSEPTKEDETEQNNYIILLNLNLYGTS